MKSKLAGHEWLDQKIDSWCILPKAIGDEPCLMTRAVLFQATEADVNKDGFAHSAQLTQYEYNDVVAERTAYEEYCDKVMAALREVCG